MRDHVLLEVGWLVLQIDPGRSARFGDSRDRAAWSRDEYTERRVVSAVSLPTAHDLSPVRAFDVAHGCRSARPEQPADLLRDGVEEPLRVRLGRDGDRDAAERRLLVGQGRELLAGLRVRECHSDEPRELPESLLGVRRKLQFAGERHDDGAPDVARDDDRRGDEGGHAERDQPSAQLRGNAGVVRGHGEPALPSARPG